MEEGGALIVGTSGVKLNGVGQMARRNGRKR